MKSFLNDNFLLSTNTAAVLYHDYAKKMPVLDYHCHLSPELIANDTVFDTITQAWLSGDHYKWRAMRTNGVAEEFCTGNKTDWEKFQQWSATVPYTYRNPLYHWTHLELQRYFGIKDILNEQSALAIYDACNQQLNSTGFSTRQLLKKMNVELVCTTDDPTDDLRFHQKIKQDDPGFMVLPAFRPDKAMQVNDPAAFLQYAEKLAEVSSITISSFDDYLYALQNRHDYFAANGCRLSDHGLEEIYADDFTGTEINSLFKKILGGKNLDNTEQRKLKSALLIHFAEWDNEKGWVQQFHLGALRNNNSRQMAALGADTGWDSIGDFNQGPSLTKFLNKLDATQKLSKTILYNLNPADNALMATMIGNFNDGSVAGKIQWGSAWWFLDQKDGIINHLNCLSNCSLLSRFIGMLTDSRSFLSFPRHEYFRRLLCGLIGSDIENGELPGDIRWAGKMVEDICYYNNLNYFGWKFQDSLT
jgi:glucuronate isomerase